MHVLARQFSPRQLTLAMSNYSNLTLFLSNKARCYHRCKRCFCSMMHFFSTCPVLAAVACLLSSITLLSNARHTDTACLCLLRGLHDSYSRDVESIYDLDRKTRREGQSRRAVETSAARVYPSRRRVSQTTLVVINQVPTGARVVRSEMLRSNLSAVLLETRVVRCDVHSISHARTTAAL